MSRITRALLALVAARARRAGASAAAPTLVPVGRFDTADVRDRAAAATRSACSSSSAPGASGSCATAPRWRRRSSTSRPRWRPTASAACSRWRSPRDYEQSGLFYVYMVARDPVGELQVREYRRSARDPDVADADRADRLARDAQRGHQPQRRPDRVGARRPAVVRDRRRRRRQRPVRPRARPLPARSGRCCGSTRARATPAATRSRT